MSNTTYNGNVSISNKYNIDIIGQGYNSSYINGNVSINNSDYCDLSYIKTKEISTNNSWISLYSLKADRFSIYGDEVQINYCRFSSGQAPNQITNCDGTIGFSNITDCMIGVYLVSNSAYNIGNNYFCQNESDIYAFSGSVAYAKYNTYSYNPYQSCFGNVIISGTTNTCGLYKLAKRNLFNGLQIDKGDLSKQEFSSVDQQYLDLLQDINNEKVSIGTFSIKEYENDYDAIIYLYKDFLAKYPKAEEASTAVFRTVHCYQQKDDYKGYYDFIQSLLTDKKYDIIKPNVERHLVNNFIHMKEYNEAVESADKVISYSKNDENLYCELLYEKGLIYKYQLKNKDKAGEMFLKILKEYPNNKIINYAEFELNKFDIKVGKESQNERKLARASIGFTCESYPNPFNPSTTISYFLPSESNVKLIIYDIMGRRINSLITDTQIGGRYKIVWDGTNYNGVKVSSGIYIYRFEAMLLSNNKPFVKSAKLMLVK